MPAPSSEPSTTPVRSAGRAAPATLAKLLAAAGAALFLAPAPGAAHGGGHLPPPPELPPPPSSPPPTNPGPGDARRPPPTGPTGPSRPGPATPGPSGPSGPAQPSTPGGPAVTGGGGAFDPGEWSVWWDLNQHAYLGLREAIWRGPTLTGDDEFFLGHGTTTGVPTDLKPKDAQLAERVAPALKRVARTERQPDVLSGCLTALAKLGEVPVRNGEETTAAFLAGFLDHANQQIRETAAVSLGILGSSAALRDLVGLASGDDHGRKLSGNSKVSERTRAFAAYGLGVLGSRTEIPDLRRWVVHHLARILEEESRGSLDVTIACLHGLALIELPSRPAQEGDGELPPAASREALLAYALDLYEDADLEDRALAHAARALARGTAASDDGQAVEILGALLDVAERRKSRDRLVQYGAIAALGLAPRSADAGVEKGTCRALAELDRDRDVLARDFALVSLAQAASRPGSSPEATALAREHLLLKLAKGKSRERPWAALALGLLGHGLRQEGIAPSTDVDLALRQSLDDCGSPADAGAYAIALGLRGAIAGAGLVREKLDRFAEDRVRGHMALALGLMRDRESTDALRELLPESVYRPELIRPLAIALALLDDESLVPWLVEKIETTDSSSVRAVYAWTLAHVGDARAVDPLVALLEDMDVPTLTRGIAALGLGITCERTLVPWNTELARNANYPAAVPSLFDPQGGGVLNIR